MGDTKEGTGKAKTRAACSNRNHIHLVGVLFIAIAMLVVGGAFVWTVKNGNGEPTTMQIGKIYKVHAFVQLDVINWKERSEGLLVREEAQGAYPQFVEVPRREVEGEIAVGKGIMKLLIGFGPGDSSSGNVFRYKTGDLADLQAELAKLKGK